MYIELWEKHGLPVQSQERTALVMNYEQGDVAKSLVYIAVNGPRGYMNELKIALADLMTQTGLLIEQNGWDIEEVREIGLERFDHRLSEMAKWCPPQ